MHVLLAAALLSLPVSGDGVKLNLVSKGAMSKIGNYAPQRVTLSPDRPETLKKAPDGLKSPLYGVITIAGMKNAVYHVIIDEPEGQPAHLFIDTNGDGDLTNDPAAPWTGRESGKDGERALTMWSGSGEIRLGDDYQVSLGVYRFDKTDPKREALKNILLYYRDYAVEGEIPLGGKSYKVLLNDSAASGDFRGKQIDANDKDAQSGVTFMIDINGNGKFDNRGESFDIRKPFNIGGTTYELAGVASNGLSMNVVKSSKTVAEIPLPPDHTVGKKITSFEAKSTEGKTVHFPSDFKGKIVMVDFWATWCGPCMGEVPNLVEVYKEYHPQGFEVLGVSLDTDKTVEQLRPVTKDKGMTWTQICDAKGWKAEIAQLYAVDSIPACWLVDGDTGEILATENSLRGKKLEDTIKSALAHKKGT